MSDDGRRSRRELLTSWFGAFRDASKAAVHADTPDPEKVLRPPGALTPDEAFLDACTRCADCIPVCPVDAIVTIEEEDGRRLPVIDPSVKPCRLCDDLPCVAACPDGALVAPPEGPARVRMGIAKVDPRRCVTFKGELCTVCYKACPYPDKAIMMIGSRPLVGSSACTGCGLCEYACPEHPKAIVVVPERDLVPGLRVPRTEYTGSDRWSG